MQPPVIDRKGKAQRVPANKPGDKVLWGEFGPEVEHLPVAATDPAADREFLRMAARPDTKPTRRRRLLTQRALTMLAAGWDTNDIAAALGVATSTLTTYLTKHKREVTIAEIDDRLDRIAVPLATDNLIHGLLAGDKDYTLKTLEGRGRFRKHADVETKGEHVLPALEIRFTIETPPGGADPSQLPPGTPSADSLIAGGRILGTMALPKSVGSATLADRGMEVLGTARAFQEEVRSGSPAESRVGTVGSGVVADLRPPAGPGDPDT